jgi:hypothetical protein
MKKTTGKSTSSSTKITFGVRRKGKAQKRSGPRDSKSKKYRGQGR